VEVEEINLQTSCSVEDWPPSATAADYYYYYSVPSSGLAHFFGLVYTDKMNPAIRGLTIALGSG